ncbi:hypothetical protein D3C81_549550 [compost metagenome]
MVHFRTVVQPISYINSGQIIDISQINRIFIRSSQTAEERGGVARCPKIKGIAVVGFFNPSDCRIIGNRCTLALRNKINSRKLYVSGCSV